MPGEVHSTVQSTRGLEDRQGDCASSLDTGQWPGRPDWRELLLPVQSLAAFLISLPVAGDGSPMLLQMPWRSIWGPSPLKTFVWYPQIPSWWTTGVAVPNEIPVSDCPYLLQAHT